MLTSRPRLVYFDARTRARVGEIAWSAQVCRVVAVVVGTAILPFAASSSLRRPADGGARVSVAGRTRRHRKRNTLNAALLTRAAATPPL